MCVRVYEIECLGVYACVRVWVRVCVCGGGGRGACVHACVRLYVCMKLN